MDEAMNVMSLMASQPDRPDNSKVAWEQKSHELSDLVANPWPGHRYGDPAQDCALHTPLNQGAASKIDKRNNLHKHLLLCHATASFP
jgi:hypothetical protein